MALLQDKNAKFPSQLKCKISFVYLKFDLRFCVSSESLCKRTLTSYKKAESNKLRLCLNKKFSLTYFSDGL